MSAVVYRDGFASGVKLLQRCEECSLCPEHEHVFAGDKAIIELGSRLWASMDCAPRDGTLFLAWVEDEDGDGAVRFVNWGKTSHVPMYGFCLRDQGVEDSDLCDPKCWMPIPDRPARELLLAYRDDRENR